MRRVINLIMVLSFLAVLLFQISCTYDYFEDETNYILYVPEVEEGSVTDCSVFVYADSGQLIAKKTMSTQTVKDPRMAQGLFGFKLFPGSYKVYCYTNTDSISFSNISKLQEAAFTAHKRKSGQDHYVQPDVAWNESSSSIRITKKETNVSNTIFSDVLHFKLGNFDIPIVVTQHYLDFKYTLECSSVTLHGVYRPSIALNSANDFIKLKFIAENRDMIGLEYVIETVPINGIVFKAKGLITESAMESRGGQEVTLLGSGILTTPIEHRTDPFIVTIESNSSSGSFCEVTVSPVLGKINIVTHGLDRTFGYNLTNNRPSNWVLNAPSNFGPNDDSRVKIEGFNIINGGNPSSMSAEVKLWLTGKKKVVDPDTKLTHNVMADIYHMAYNSYIAETDVPILLEFMKNGGIVILFMENDHPLRLFKEMYGIPSLTLGSTSGRKPLPLLGNEVFRLAQNKSIEEWETVLVDLRKDPILNGPFGDITEFQWGEDASSYRYINGIPENDTHTTVYSLDYTLESGRVLSSGTKGVSAFKYESDTYNLIYVGDGGFTSQSGTEDSYTICPFWYDKTTLFPIPKPYRYDIDVYNSQMFCNMMAWAIDRANDPLIRAKKDKVIKEAQGK